MARKTKKDALARHQDTDEQPPLFDYAALPVRPDIVQIVQESRYVHTGARLLDNEELTARVVERLCLRHGVKRIAQEMGISPHSIRAAREVLVAQGKMAPFVKRFTDKVQDILEIGLERFEDGVDSGAVHAGQLPVGLGILWDKRALALGEPTTISLNAGVALKPESLAVETLNDWAAKLPSEAESLGTPMKQAQVMEERTVEAGFGAAEGARVVDLERGQAVANGTEAEASRRAEGGGGDAGVAGGG